MEIKAKSKLELTKRLARSDISVLPRWEGRNNSQIERWVMYRTLSTLLDYGIIEYPVSLLKRERPDYLLSTGKKLIGCEITEAINGDYLKTQSLPEASNESSVVDVSLFKWGSKKRDIESLRKIASKEKLTGPGWDGNSVEREYAKIVYDVTQTKTTKMYKPGFEKFEQNDLLIYCNQTLPILDVTEATNLCSKLLSDYWSSSSFSRVFVEKSENIVMYSEGNYEVLAINDLWKNG